MTATPSIMMKRILIAAVGKTDDDNFGTGMGHDPSSERQVE
jgi:hypothetical protein